MNPGMAPNKMMLDLSVLSQDILNYIAIIPNPVCGNLCRLFLCSFELYTAWETKVNVLLFVSYSTNSLHATLGMIYI